MHSSCFNGKKVCAWRQIADPDVKTGATEAMALMNGQVRKSKAGWAFVTPNQVDRF
jgi:hypothetical protein